jgi:hypothetical protein
MIQGGSHSMNMSQSCADADAYIAELQDARRAVRAQRDQQVATLYPNARTFVLKRADPVGADAAAELAATEIPATMTLVTPDPADPSRDQLFIGPYPVLARDQRWNAAFEELDFATSDGVRPISGTFRMTHSRLRAYGAIALGDHTVSVEYEVDPQRYRVKVAKNAAYLAAPANTITWDTSSDRWKNAEWGKDYELGFTFGVNGEEVIGDEKEYTFVASFDDITTGREWKPAPGTYTGRMTRDLRLVYTLLGGVKPPTGPGTALFPYQLLVKLSEFGFDFAGGMVVGEPGPKGTVYGMIGDWTGNGIAGLYHLEHDGRDIIFSVHDRTLFANTTPAADTRLDGDTLTWSGLDQQAAAAAGIPVAGSVTFSPDGSAVVGSSFGAVGGRITADQALAMAGRLTDSGFAGILREASANVGDDDHKLPALLRMSQFTVDEEGKFYDQIQSEAMEDFYAILQNYMDPDLRKTFFRDTPPPLDNDLRDIAKVKGTKGTDPLPWFRTLSVPYTATCVGKFSDDAYARTLNTIRAEQWISVTTSASDVMSAQTPLLYQRRYGAKHKNLAWFLTDQKLNADVYAPQIDAAVDKWLKQARDANVGTPEEMAKLEERIKALGAHAKKHKLYWAIQVYAGTSTPSYLNMLKLIIMSGVEYDGSEFTQRVQRTVALLNVLDITGFFAKEYAYLLQMFEVSSILPETLDLSGDFGDFQYVLKKVIEKFIDTYINHPDPGMREVAEALRQHANEEFITKMLAILRTSAAVGYGLSNWSFLAQRFESICAKRLAGVPSMVIKFGALAGMGVLLGFFLTGGCDWNSLSDQQRGFVILAATNTCAVALITIIKQGLALHAVWDSSAGVFKQLMRFFDPFLVNKAQGTVTTGLRGYLLSEAGPRLTPRLGMPQAANARQALAGEAEPLLGGRRSRTWVRRLFGKNLSRFMARALTGAFSILGIVLSAIDLANSTDPMEKAANIMFIIASSLELVAAVGGWLVAGAGISALFSCVAFIGFVALVIGAILLIVLMTRPQQSPVEKFAKERAGDLYMQYRAAIESFRLYQPIGQPQRSGIAMYVGDDKAKCLRIGSDGAVSQGAFDETAHTAFYVSTDDRGRARFGAPVSDAEGKPMFLCLSVAEDGRVTSKNFISDDLTSDPKALWYADILGDGTYEETVPGVKELKSAPFRLRSAFFADDKKATRYLALDGTAGWKLVDKAEDAARIRLEMVATKPAELGMADVTWYTIAHNELTGPALQVPGSYPRRWAISPALPEGLVFDAEDGSVSMIEGYDVPPAARRTYTLTVANDLGRAETTFDLEILVPDDDELVLS